jgi:hypothetical protein
MTDSKRLTILKALTDLLEGIDNTPPDPLPEGWTPEYQHNLSGRVGRGVSVVSANQALPFVTILEYPTVEFTSDFVGQHDKFKHQWDLMIQGWAREEIGDESNNPTDPVYLLMADVQKRLARIRDMGGAHAPGADYMLGGLLTGFDMTPGTVRPADENSNVPCFYLRVRLGVAETTGDPYALT